MAKIAVLGDIYTDIQTGPLEKMPSWNCDLHADTIKIMVGGSAANTARYLGQLGLKTRLFSSLGSDSNSESQLRKLVDENLVETHGSVVKIEGTICPTAVVIFGNKNRGFISNNGCLKTYCAQHIKKSLLFQYDHLHIGGYFVCLGLQDNSFSDLLAEYKKKNFTISMDCQFDSTLKWTGKDGNLKKLLPFLDVFMPSETEAMGITGKNTLEEALETLSSQMPNAIVIVKNGENGALFRLPKARASETPETYHVSAIKTDVVDTTGAGDAFNAGFLQKWVSFDKKNDVKSVFEAVTSGCRLGSESVKSKGAFVGNIYTNKDAK